MTKHRINVDNSQFRTCTFRDFDSQEERSLSKVRPIERNQERTKPRWAEVCDPLDGCTGTFAGVKKRGAADAGVSASRHSLRLHRRCISQRDWRDFQMVE
jgi:hypothetical protein